MHFSSWWTGSLRSWEDIEQAGDVRIPPLQQLYKQLCSPVTRLGGEGNGSYSLSLVELVLLRRWLFWVPFCPQEWGSEVEPLATKQIGPLTTEWCTISWKLILIVELWCLYYFHSESTKLNSSKPMLYFCGCHVRLLLIDRILCESYLEKAGEWNMFVDCQTQCPEGEIFDSWDFRWSTDIGSLRNLWVCPHRCGFLLPHLFTFFFCSLRTKMNPWFITVDISLIKCLHVVVAAVANPGLPKYVDSVFSTIFPSKAERRKVLKISITAASRGGTGCCNPAARLWNLFPFTFAAALISFSHH